VPHPTEVELVAMKTDGDRIRMLLDAEYATARRFPRSVDTDSSCEPVMERGGWEYHTRDGGERYSLSVGSYDRDAFVLYWSGSDGRWEIDR
jgi:hypothetical protein